MLEGKWLNFVGLKLTSLRSYDENATIITSSKFKLFSAPTVPTLIFRIVQNELEEMYPGAGHIE